MSPARVLLIEDTPAQAEEILKALARAGYEAVWEKNGLLGLKRAKTEHPDLILLDVVLPDITGHEVCRWLKHDEGTRGIPIIMLTSQSAVEDRVRGLQMGADDYLPKPFNEMELAARIYAALRTKALQDELREKNQRLEALLRQVEEMAVTDPVTGLYNRRRFEESLASEFARAKRYHNPLSCVLLDVDGFKAINDTFGHQVGDGVLVEVARMIQAGFRDTDIVARFGGDEFVVLLPQTRREEAIRPAVRVLTETRKHAFSGLEPDHTVTLSIGIAGIPHPAITSPEQLLQAADSALYQAKENGRNRIEVHGEA